MKQAFISIFIITIILSFSSCIENVNVKQAFDIDAELVLFSRICPQADTNYAFLYSSTPFFSTQNATDLAPLSSAVIEISTDEDNWSRYDYDKSKEAFILTKDVFTVKEGETYFIRAACAGYKTVTSSCKTPYMREVNLKLSQDTVVNTYYDYILDEYVEYEFVENIFNWTDFPNEENYYMLYTTIGSTKVEWNYDEEGNVIYDSIYYISLAYTFDNEDRYIFSDDGRDGKEMQSANYVHVSGNDYQMLDTVRFFMLDKSSYLYEISMEKYYNSMGVELLTLFEPVLIHSNIENGLGLFGAFNQKLYSVKEILVP